MIYTLIQLFAIYWIILSLISYYVVRKAFLKYKKYPLFYTEAKYEPFVRRDFGKWNQKQIIKGCFTRSPIHFPLILIGNIVYALSATLHQKLKFPTAKMVDWLRKKLTMTIFRIGFEVIEEFDNNEKFTTPIVIMNHTSDLDIFYIGSHLPLVSFVSKKEVSNIPIACDIAKFLDCLYVDRKDVESRNKIKRDILERVDQYKEDPHSVLPILIFPQGTTTNGRSIIKFKRGAFEPLCPVTIIAMNYQCKQFDIGLDEIQQPYYGLIISSLRPKLTVKKDVVEPKKNESVEEFEERCRRRLGEMTGYELYDSEVKDFLQLQKKRKEFKVARKELQKNQ